MVGVVEGVQVAGRRRVKDVDLRPFVLARVDVADQLVEVLEPNASVEILEIGAHRVDYVIGGKPRGLIQRFLGERDCLLNFTAQMMDTWTMLDLDQDHTLFY